MKKHPISYQIKTETITMEYNKQCIAFTGFGAGGKKSFVKFRQAIEQENPQDLNALFYKARIYKVGSQSVSRIVY